MSGLLALAPLAPWFETGLIEGGWQVERTSLSHTPARLWAGQKEGHEAPGAVHLSVAWAFPDLCLELIEVEFRQSLSRFAELTQGPGHCAPHAAPAAPAALASQHPEGIFLPTNPHLVWNQNFLPPKRGCCS